MVSIELKML
jgi:hypothetical protein